MQDSELEHRLTALEEGQKSIMDKMNEFFDNHFTDLQADVTDIKKKMGDRPTWITTIAVSVVIGLLTYFITTAFK